MSLNPIVSSSSHLIFTSQAPVTALVGQTPTTLGRGMAANFSVPRLADLSFHARGLGRFPLVEAVPPGDVRFNRGPKIAGQQGTIDIYVTMGAAGAARDILTVADTTELSLLQGSIIIGTSATTNRPSIAISDPLGNIVAQSTPSSGAFADGERVRLRVTWDSANPVPGGTDGRHVTFAINGNQIPVADWSTNPTSGWTPLVPVQLWLGLPTLAGTEFNGTVDAMQASNTVTV